MFYWGMFYRTIYKMLNLWSMGAIALSLSDSPHIRKFGERGPVAINTAIFLCCQIPNPKWWVRAGPHTPMPPLPPMGLNQGRVMLVLPPPPPRPPTEDSGQAPFPCAAGSELGCPPATSVWLDGTLGPPAKPGLQSDHAPPIQTTKQKRMSNTAL